MTSSMSSEITRRLFIVGVVAVAVIPRHQIDRDRWSIGGEISYPFRKLLLFVAGLSFFKLLLLSFPQHSLLVNFTDALGIVQQLGHTFLCFLSPYLLQTWLAPLINIGGRPGASLMVPLYICTFMSVSSIALVHLVHERFLSIRTLGNVFSTPPVLRTLKMFNSVTTRGGHHDGRGTIISQSLMAIEWWYAITQFLCATGTALKRTDSESTSDTPWDIILAAFRDIKFASDWSRILIHAIFMNQLDELYLSYSPPRATSSEGDEKRDGDDVEMATSLELSKIIPRNSRATNSV